MELIALGVASAIIMAAGIIHANARTHAGKMLGIRLAFFALVAEVAFTVIIG